MNKPLPDDFPDMDLEAWRAALPMPAEPEPDGLDDMIAFAIESAEATPPAPEPARPRSEPPPFTLSPVEARGIRRRKEKP